MTYSFDENLVSDLYKAAFGFRPSSDYMRRWDLMSDSEKQEEWDHLVVNMEFAVEIENSNNAFAIEQFESLVAETIALGAGDEETAIRWIIEGMDLSDNDLMYGEGYVCFQLGLPYSMESKFTPVIASMR